MSWLNSLRFGPGWIAVAVCMTLTSHALAFVQAAALPAQTPSDVYVWQRLASPELALALKDQAPQFERFRVLAAQLEQNATAAWVAMQIDVAMYVKASRPITLVFRLPGSQPIADAEPLNQKIAAELKRWRAAGLKTDRVEIDFDCAESKLPGYIGLLKNVRKSLPSDTALDITALPSWLANAQFKTLFASADQVTLQVHSVLSPEKGLFDARKAEYWIRTLDAIASKPYAIALPAYGARLLLDQKNRVIGVEHEADIQSPAARTQEMQSDPRAVQALMEALKRTPAKRLQRWVWFRLPLPSDQRTWSSVTLNAVMQSQRLQSRTVVEYIDNETGGKDVKVTSVGNMAASPPLRIAVARHCTGEGIGPYYFAGSAFTATNVGTLQLRPGQSLIVGWLRCELESDE